MEEQKMALSLNTKITALALTAALLGGSIGAIVEHNSSSKANQESAKTATTFDQNSSGQAAEDNSLNNGATADNSQLASTSSVDNQSTANTTEYMPAKSRTVASAQPVRSSSTSRSVYRSHETARHVSGWEKHRNILTVAMGAGGGALLGGLIGGRKGTAIGALAGAGGGALYTYKLRKKNQQ